MRVQQFAIREKGYFSKLQGPEMGWRGLAAGQRTRKKKLYLRKIHSFVIDKYVEDIKQDQKSVPDLLESMMNGSGIVKEELRMVLMKMDQFKTKITKIKVSTVWMSRQPTDSRRRKPQPSRPVSFKPIMARHSGEKNVFWRRQAPVTLLSSFLARFQANDSTHFAEALLQQASWSRA